MQNIWTRRFEGVGKRSSRRASSNSCERFLNLTLNLLISGMLPHERVHIINLTSISKAGNLKGFWKMWQKCAMQGTSHQLLITAFGKGRGGINCYGNKNPLYLQWPLPRANIAGELIPGHDYHYLAGFNQDSNCQSWSAYSLDSYGEVYRDFPLHKAHSARQQKTSSPSMGRVLCYPILVDTTAQTATVFANKQGSGDH